MNTSIFRDPALLAEIEKHARHKHVEKDAVLIKPGSDIVFVPIVEQGVLRIVREDEEGREIFLYHLYPGQTCAMAINCCQAGEKSMVKAIAEDDSEILQVPVKKIDEWLKYGEWKTFINSTYGVRFAELINVIDLIAFSKMDEQVLHYLRERVKATGSKTLFITHQQIADELYTSREVISRLLRSMENKGLVRIGRSSIELLNGKKNHNHTVA